MKDQVANSSMDGNMEVWLNIQYANFKKDQRKLLKDQQRCRVAFDQRGSRGTEQRSVSAKISCIISDHSLLLSNNCNSVFKSPNRVGLTALL